MTNPIPYHLVDDAVPALLSYCRQQGHNRFFLVADENTYAVLGKRVEMALQTAGWDVKVILLKGKEIVTDEHFVVQAQVETGGESRCFLAIGSGTITDITRFVSHRSHDPFIAIPTAPSVDGFTSTVAPMVVGNYKSPIPAQPPVAVFADLPTLCAAPRRLIAAGFGDLLGKYTSLADWEIGHLLYDEPFDSAIQSQMRAAVDQTVVVVDSIASGSPEGISRLMDGLVGSGFGMLAFGDSRPASGSEHHIGHFWEMKMILEGRPASLHGAEVGVATIYSAQRYSLLRQMSRSDAVNALSNRGIPSADAMRAEIQEGYGIVSPKIIQIQAPLLEISVEMAHQLKSRILNHWEAIHSIAQSVPTPEQIVHWIKAVGGPTTPHELSLDGPETELALRCAHYLRDRFTLNRLGFWLDLPFGN